MKMSRRERKMEAQKAERAELSLQKTSSSKKKKKKYRECKHYRLEVDTSIKYSMITISGLQLKNTEQETVPVLATAPSLISEIVSYPKSIDPWNLYGCKIHNLLVPISDTACKCEYCKKTFDMSDYQLVEDWKQKYLGKQKAEIENAETELGLKPTLFRYTTRGEIEYL